MDSRHPSAEVDVDVSLAKQLLEEQHPALLAGPLSLVDEGWDNITFRVGSDLALRLPRRNVAVQLALNEQRWLPVVAPWLDVAVPVPVGIGVPSRLFPWPWSVVPWIEGSTCDEEALAPSEGELLARVMRSLHRFPPPDAPLNPFRGVPLSSRQNVVEERLDRLRLSQLTPLWEQALATPPARDAVWIHGDLHPRNVVVREGALVGIIDWGDMTVGDPATDLACAWMLLDSQGRSALFDVYQPSSDERSRAIGWAVNFASAMIDSRHPKHTSIGQRVIERLVASE